MINPPALNPIEGAPAEVEQLRQSVAYAFQKLVAQLNTTDFTRQQPSGPLKMQGQRIGDVADPSSGKDAVNRDYLDRRLKGMGGGGSLTINSTSTGGGGSGSTIATLDITLTAASTVTINPTAPVAAGDVLSVFVKAKGTSALLAWGSRTKFAPTEFDSATDTWTVFNFVGRSDPDDSTLKWFYIGPQGVTGAS